MARIIDRNILRLARHADRSFDFRLFIRETRQGTIRSRNGQRSIFRPRDLHTSQRAGYCPGKKRIPGQGTPGGHDPRHEKKGWRAHTMQCSSPRFPIRQSHQLRQPNPDLIIYTKRPVSCEVGIQGSRRCTGPDRSQAFKRRVNGIGGFRSHRSPFQATLELTLPQSIPRSTCLLIFDKLC